MEKDIKIGVIGLGYGATLFPLNTKSDSRLKVTAISALPNKEAARPFMEKWDVDYYTDDYRELVSKSDLDIIGVFTPDNLHYEHVKEALLAGKHVIVTKPLTDNVDRAIELAKLARKNRLKVMVGQSLRFELQSIALKKLLDDGDLGSVIFTEAHYLHDMREVLKRTPWRLKKKWLLGAGCHPLDAVRWVGGDIKRLQAFANRGKVTDYPLNDNFIINIEFESGAIGRALLLVGCVQSPEPQMKISVFGSKGSGYASSIEGKDAIAKVVLDRIIKRPVMDIDLKDEPEIDAGAYSSHTQNVLRYMAYFEDCIVKDIEPSPNATDGAKTLIAANAAQESIDTGKVIEIDNEVLA